MNAPVSILAATYKRIKAELLAEYPDLADDAEALADTLDGLTEAGDVVASLVRRAREAEAFAAANKRLAKDYQERASYLELRSDRLRASALSLMEAMGEKKIKRPEFTVSITHTKGQLEVYDEDQLPEGFFKYRREVDRTALAAAAEPPPGTRMTNGSSHLTVRVK